MLFAVLVVLSAGSAWIWLAYHSQQLMAHMTSLIFAWLKSRLCALFLTLSTKSNVWMEWHREMASNKLANKLKSTCYFDYCFCIIFLLVRISSLDFCVLFIRFVGQKQYGHCKHCAQLNRMVALFLNVKKNRWPLNF